MTQTELRDAVIANAADIELAEIMALRCDNLEFNADEEERRKSRLSVETAKTFNFDRSAINASPLIERLKNFKSDTEFKSLLSKKMTEYSQERNIRLDDTAATCEAGAIEVANDTDFGRLLAPDDKTNGR